MKILLRQFRNDYYVWKDAVWRDKNYIITVDEVDPFDDTNEVMINQTDILAVAQDDRKDYVVCNFCGALIRNDPISIEKHYAEREACKDCLKCPYLVTRGSRYNIKAKYEKNADGTYHVVENFDANLGCKMSSYYSPRDINDPRINQSCTYYSCRSNGVSPIKDVFVQYPDLFEKQITVDALIAKKYQCNGFKRGYFEYDLKCRGTFVACVNELGIVDHFTLNYRYSRIKIYYSAKYNKLFFHDYSRYSTDAPSHVSETKLEQITKRIAELYKEVK